jgi:hypothetical protein
MLTKWIQDLAMSNEQEMMFINKLNIIHQTVKLIQHERAREREKK